MSELSAFLALSPYVIFLIFLALLFDFLNGMNDAANSIATVVSTRVLKPIQAVGLAAFFNFIAAFGMPLLVARTIGTGIIDTRISTPVLVFVHFLDLSSGPQLLLIGDFLYLFPMLLSEV